MNGIRKIRREIKDCALFVPIISANSEARHEGYFRLEWDLADQRSHMIARGRPFLVPVSLDETRAEDCRSPGFLPAGAVDAVTRRSDAA